MSGTLNNNTEMMDMLVKTMIGTEYTSSELTPGQEKMSLEKYQLNQVFSQPIPDGYGLNWSESEPYGTSEYLQTVSYLESVTHDSSNYNHIFKYENIAMKPILSGENSHSWKPIETEFQEKLKFAIKGKLNLMFKININRSNDDGGHIITHDNSLYLPIINNGILIFMGNEKPLSTDQITLKEVFIYEGTVGYDQSEIFPKNTHMDSVPENIGKIYFNTNSSTFLECNDNNGTIEWVPLGYNFFKQSEITHSQPPKLTIKNVLSTPSYIELEIEYPEQIETLITSSLSDNENCDWLSERNGNKYVGYPIINRLKLRTIWSYNDSTEIIYRKSVYGKHAVKDWPKKIRIFLKENYELAATNPIYQLTSPDSGCIIQESGEEIILIGNDYGLNEIGLPSKQENYTFELTLENFTLNSNYNSVSTIATFEKYSPPSVPRHFTVALDHYDNTINKSIIKFEIRDPINTINDSPSFNSSVFLHSFKIEYYNLYTGIWSPLKKLEDQDLGYMGGDKYLVNVNSRDLLYTDGYISSGTVLNLKISLISDKINMEYLIGADENTLQLAWQNMEHIDISDYICEVINTIFPAKAELRYQHEDDVAFYVDVQEGVLTIETVTINANSALPTSNIFYTDIVGESSYNSGIYHINRYNDSNIREYFTEFSNDTIDFGTLTDGFAHFRISCRNAANITYGPILESNYLTWTEPTFIPNINNIEWKSMNSFRIHWDENWTLQEIAGINNDSVFLSHLKFICSLEDSSTTIDVHADNIDIQHIIYNDMHYIDVHISEITDNFNNYLKVSFQIAMRNNLLPTYGPLSNVYNLQLSKPTTIKDISTYHWISRTVLNFTWDNNDYNKNEIAGTNYNTSQNFPNDWVTINKIDYEYATKKDNGNYESITVTYVDNNESININLTEDDLDVSDTIEVVVRMKIYNNLFKNYPSEWGSWFTLSLKKPEFTPEVISLELANSTSNNANLELNFTWNTSSITRTQIAGPDNTSENIPNNFITLNKLDYQVTVDKDNDVNILETSSNDSPNDNSETAVLNKSNFVGNTSIKIYVKIKFYNLVFPNLSTVWSAPRMIEIKKPIFLSSILPLTNISFGNKLSDIIQNYNPDNHPNAAYVNMLNNKNKDIELSIPINQTNIDFFGQTGITPGGTISYIPQKWHIKIEYLTHDTNTKVYNEKIVNDLTSFGTQSDDFSSLIDFHNILKNIETSPISGFNTQTGEFEFKIYIKNEFINEYSEFIQKKLKFGLSKPTAPIAVGGRYKSGNTQTIVDIRNNRIGNPDTSNSLNFNFAMPRFRGFEQINPNTELEIGLSKFKYSITATTGEGNKLYNELFTNPQVYNSPEIDITDLNAITKFTSHRSSVNLQTINFNSGGESYGTSNEALIFKHNFDKSPIDDTQIIPFASPITNDASMVNLTQFFWPDVKYTYTLQFKNSESDEWGDSFIEGNTKDLNYIGLDSTSADYLLDYVLEFDNNGNVSRFLDIPTPLYYPMSQNDTLKTLTEGNSVYLLSGHPIQQPLSLYSNLINTSRDNNIFEKNIQFGESITTENSSAIKDTFFLGRKINYYGLDVASSFDNSEIISQLNNDGIKFSDTFMCRFNIDPILTMSNWTKNTHFDNTPGNIRSYSFEVITETATEDIYTLGGTSNAFQIINSNVGEGDIFKIESIVEDENRYYTSDKPWSDPRNKGYWYKDTVNYEFDPSKISATSTPTFNEKFKMNFISRTNSNNPSEIYYDNTEWSAKYTNINDATGDNKDTVKFLRGGTYTINEKVSEQTFKQWDGDGDDNITLKEHYINNNDDWMIITENKDLPGIQKYDNETTPQEPIIVNKITKINGIPNLFGPNYIPENFNQQIMKLTINDSFFSTDTDKSISFSDSNNTATISTSDEPYKAFKKRFVYMWPDWISTGRNISQTGFDGENFYHYSNNNNHEWLVTMSYVDTLGITQTQSHNITISAKGRNKLGYWTYADITNSLATKMAQEINSKFTCAIATSEIFPGMQINYDDYPVIFNGNHIDPYWEHPLHFIYIESTVGFDLNITFDELNSSSWRPTYKSTLPTININDNINYWQDTLAFIDGNSINLNMNMVLDIISHGEWTMIFGGDPVIGGYGVEFKHNSSNSISSYHMSQFDLGESVNKKLIALNEKYSVLGITTNPGKIIITKMISGSETIFETIDCPDKSSSDSAFFGGSVVLKDDFIIVGAQGFMWDDAYKGAVFIFKYNENEQQFKEVNRLKGFAGYNNFGTDLAINHNYLVVLAKDFTINNNSALYLYDIDTSLDILITGNMRYHNFSHDKITSIAMSNNYFMYGEDNKVQWLNLNNDINTTSPWISSPNQITAASEFPNPNTSQFNTSGFGKKVKIIDDYTTIYKDDGFVIYKRNGTSWNMVGCREDYKTKNIHITNDKIHYIKTGVQIYGYIHSIKMGGRYFSEPTNSGIHIHQMSTNPSQWIIWHGDRPSSKIKMVLLEFVWIDNILYIQPVAARDINPTYYWNGVQTVIHNIESRWNSASTAPLVNSWDDDGYGVTDIHITVPTPYDVDTTINPETYDNSGNSVIGEPLNDEFLLAKGDSILHSKSTPSNWIKNFGFYKENARDFFPQTMIYHFDKEYPATDSSLTTNQTSDTKTWLLDNGKTMIGKKSALETIQGILNKNIAALRLKEEIDIHFSSNLDTEIKNNELNSIILYSKLSTIQNYSISGTNLNENDYETGGKWDDSNNFQIKLDFIDTLDTLGGDFNIDIKNNGTNISSIAFEQQHDLPVKYELSFDENMIGKPISLKMNIAETGDGNYFTLGTTNQVNLYIPYFTVNGKQVSTILNTNSDLQYKRIFENANSGEYNHKPISYYGRSDNDEYYDFELKEKWTSSGSGWVNKVDFITLDEGIYTMQNNDILYDLNLNEIKKWNSTQLNPVTRNILGWSHIFTVDSNTNIVQGVHNNTLFLDILNNKLKKYNSNTKSWDLLTNNINKNINTDPKLPNSFNFNTVNQVITKNDDHGIKIPFSNNLGEILTTSTIYTNATSNYLFEYIDADDEHDIIGWVAHEVLEYTLSNNLPIGLDYDFYIDSKNNEFLQYSSANGWEKIANINSNTVQHRDLFYDTDIKFNNSLKQYDQENDQWNTVVGVEPNLYEINPDLLKTYSFIDKVDGYDKYYFRHIENNIYRKLLMVPRTGSLLPIFGMNNSDLFIEDRIINQFKNNQWNTIPSYILDETIIHPNQMVSFSWDEFEATGNFAVYYHDKYIGDLPYIKTESGIVSQKDPSKNIIPIQKTMQTQEDISNNVPPVYTFGDFNTDFLIHDISGAMTSITWENHRMVWSEESGTFLNDTFPLSADKIKIYKQKFNYPLDLNYKQDDLYIDAEENKFYKFNANPIYPAEPYGWIKKGDIINATNTGFPLDNMTNDSVFLHYPTNSLYYSIYSQQYLPFHSSPYHYGKYDFTNVYDVSMNFNNTHTEELLYVNKNTNDIYIAGNDIYKYNDFKTPIYYNRGYHLITSIDHSFESLNDPNNRSIFASINVNDYLYIYLSDGSYVGKIKVTGRSAYGNVIALNINNTSSPTEKLKWIENDGLEIIPSYFKEGIENVDGGTWPSGLSTADYHVSHGEGALFVIFVNTKTTDTGHTFVPANNTSDDITCYFNMQGGGGKFIPTTLESWQYIANYNLQISHEIIQNHYHPKFRFQPLYDLDSPNTTIINSLIPSEVDAYQIGDSISFYHQHLDTYENTIFPPALTDYSYDLLTTNEITDVSNNRTTKHMTADGNYYSLEDWANKIQDVVDFGLSYQLLKIVNASAYNGGTGWWEGVYSSQWSSVGAMNWINNSILYDGIIELSPNNPSGRQNYFVIADPLPDNIDKVWFHCTYTGPYWLGSNDYTWPDQVAFHFRNNPLHEEPEGAHVYRTGGRGNSDGTTGMRQQQSWYYWGGRRYSTLSSPGPSTYEEGGGSYNGLTPYLGPGTEFAWSNGNWNDSTPDIYWTVRLMVKYKEGTIDYEAKAVDNFIEENGYLFNVNENILNLDGYTDNKPTIKFEDYTLNPLFNAYTAPSKPSARVFVKNLENLVSAENNNINEINDWIEYVEPGVDYAPNTNTTLKSPNLLNNFTKSLVMRNVELTLGNSYWYKLTATEEINGYWIELDLGDTNIDSSYFTFETKIENGDNNKPNNITLLGRDYHTEEWNYVQEWTDISYNNFGYEDDGSFHYKLFIRSALENGYWENRFRYFRWVITKITSNTDGALKLYQLDMYDSNDNKIIPRKISTTRYNTTGSSNILDSENLDYLATGEYNGSTVTNHIPIPKFNDMYIDNSNNTLNVFGEEIFENPDEIGWELTRNIEPLSVDSKNLFINRSFKNKSTIFNYNNITQIWDMIDNYKPSFYSLDLVTDAVQNDDLFYDHENGKIYRYSTEIEIPAEPIGFNNKINWTPIDNLSLVNPIHDRFFYDDENKNLYKYSGVSNSWELQVLPIINMNDFYSNTEKDILLRYNIGQSKWESQEILFNVPWINPSNTQMAYFIDNENELFRYYKVSTNSWESIELEYTNTIDSVLNPPENALFIDYNAKQLNRFNSIWNIVENINNIENFVSNVSKVYVNVEYNFYIKEYDLISKTYKYEPYLESGKPSELEYIYIYVDEDGTYYNNVNSKKDNKNWLFITTTPDLNDAKLGDMFVDTDDYKVYSFWPITKEWVQKTDISAVNISSIGLIPSTNNSLLIDPINDWISYSKLAPDIEYSGKTILISDIKTYNREENDTIIETGSRYQTTWTLLFRQTFPYTWYNSNPNILNLNDNDPENDNYSILTNLENYRREDGKFHFKLVYPDIPHTKNEWLQTSNPIVDPSNVPLNYEPFNMDPEADNFHGMKRSEEDSINLFHCGTEDDVELFALGGKLLYHQGISAYGASKKLPTTSSVELWIGNQSAPSPNLNTLIEITPTTDLSNWDLSGSIYNPSFYVYQNDIFVGSINVNYDSIHVESDRILYGDNVVVSTIGSSQVFVNGYYIRSLIDNQTNNSYQGLGDYSNENNLQTIAIDNIKLYRSNEIFNIEGLKTISQYSSELSPATLYGWREELGEQLAETTFNVHNVYTSQFVDVSGDEILLRNIGNGWETLDSTYDWDYVIEQNLDNIFYLKFNENKLFVYNNELMPEGPTIGWEDASSNFTTTRYLDEIMVGDSKLYIKTDINLNHETKFLRYEENKWEPDIYDGTIDIDQDISTIGGLNENDLIADTVTNKLYINKSNNFESISDLLNTNIPIEHHHNINIDVSRDLSEISVKKYNNYYVQENNWGEIISENIKDVIDIYSGPLEGSDFNSFTSFFKITSEVENIYTNNYSNNWALRKSDGRIETLGLNTNAGNSDSVESLIKTNINNVIIGLNSAVAINNQGDVIVWGNNYDGGNPEETDGAISGTTQQAIELDELLGTANEYPIIGENITITTGKTIKAICTTGTGNTAWALIKEGSVELADNSIHDTNIIIHWGNYGGPKYNLLEVFPERKNTYNVTTQIVSNNSAFAVIKTNGTVLSWGSKYRGGEQKIYNFVDFSNDSYNFNEIQDVSTELTNVIKLTSTNYAFGALKGDNTYVTWGSSEGGSINNYKEIFSVTSSSSVENNYTGLTGTYVGYYIGNNTLIKENIISEVTVFEGVKFKSEVDIELTWTRTGTGAIRIPSITTITANSGSYEIPKNHTFYFENNNNNVTWNITVKAKNILTSVDDIYGGNKNFVVYKDNNLECFGEINRYIEFDKTQEVLITYGETNYIDTKNVKIKKIVSGLWENHPTYKEIFAALTNVQTLKIWGDETIFPNIETYEGISDIVSSNHAFALLKLDFTSYGTYKVMTTGLSFSGGDGKVYDGETEIQDNNSLLNEKIIKVVGTTSFDNSAIGAFAALKEDGSVVTWGSRKVGGHQEIVNNNGVITDLKNKLNSNVKDIIGIKGGFIAHKTDNTVISWGWHESTGNIDTPSNRGSSSHEDITSYSYLKYIDSNGVEKTNIKLVEELGNINVRDAVNDDILLDFITNTWSQMLNNSWNNMGTINIVTEIPSNNLTNLLYINLELNTILMKNSNNTPETIGWENTPPNEIKFIPSIYIDTNQNHLLRYDNRLDPEDPTQIGWETVNDYTNMNRLFLKENNFNNVLVTGGNNVEISLSTNLPIIGSYINGVEVYNNNAFLINQSSGEFKRYNTITNDFSIEPVNAIFQTPIESDLIGYNYKFTYDDSNYFYRITADGIDLDKNIDGKFSERFLNPTTPIYVNPDNNESIKLNDIVSGLISSSNLTGINYEIIDNTAILTGTTQNDLTISITSESKDKINEGDGWEGLFKDDASSVTIQKIQDKGAVNKFNDFLEALQYINNQVNANTAAVITSDLTYHPHDIRKSNPFLIVNFGNVGSNNYSITSSNTSILTIDDTYQPNTTRNFLNILTGEYDENDRLYQHIPLYLPRNEMEINIKFDITNMNENFDVGGNTGDYALDNFKNFSEITLCNQTWIDMKNEGIDRYNSQSVRFSKNITKNVDELGDDVTTYVRKNDRWEINNIQFTQEDIKISHTINDTFINRPYPETTFTKNDTIQSYIQYSITGSREGWELQQNATSTTGSVATTYPAFDFGIRQNDGTVVPFPNYNNTHTWIGRGKSNSEDTIRKYNFSMKILKTDTYYIAFNTYNSSVDGYGGYASAVAVIDDKSYYFKKSVSGVTTSRTPGLNWNVGEIHEVTIYMYLQSYRAYSGSGFGMNWTTDTHPGNTSLNSSYYGINDTILDDVTGWDERWIDTEFFEIGEWHPWSNSTAKLITTTPLEYNETESNIMIGVTGRSIYGPASYDLATITNSKKFIYDYKTWVEMFSYSPYPGDIPDYFENLVTDEAVGRVNTADLGVTEHFFNSFNTVINHNSLFLYDGKFCSTGYIKNQLSDLNTYDIPSAVVTRMNDSANDNKYRWAYLRYKVPKTGSSEQIKIIKVCFDNSVTNISNTDLEADNVVCFFQIKKGTLVANSVVHTMNNADGNSQKWIPITGYSNYTGWTLQMAEDDINYNLQMDGGKNKGSGLNDASYWNTTNTLRGAVNTVNQNTDENVYIYLAIGLKNNTSIWFKKPTIQVMATDTGGYRVANGFINYNIDSSLDEKKNKFREMQTETNNLKISYEDLYNT